MEMIKMLWSLYCPIIFYGLSVDLFSLLFKDWEPLACTLAGAAAAAPFLLAGYRRTVQPGKEESGLDGKGAVFCAFAGIAGCLVVNTLIKVSRISGIFPLFFQTADGLYRSSWPLLIGAVGLAVPVAEELVFRGLVFARLRNSISFLKAACLSAVLFAIYHGNVLQGIYGFIMGWIFSWAMERKKTIAAPIVMHMAANLTSLAVTAAWGIR